MLLRESTSSSPLSNYESCQVGFCGNLYHPPSPYSKRQLLSIHFIRGLPFAQVPLNSIFCLTLFPSFILSIHNSVQPGLPYFQSDVFYSQICLFPSSFFFLFLTVPFLICLNILTSPFQSLSFFLNVILLLHTEAQA